MPVDQAAGTTPATDRTGTLPPPVRAGIGLVAAGVDRAKRLPGRVSLADVAGLPIRGLAYVAAAREAVERTYEELANRGETVVARWRHQPLPRQTAAAPAAPTQAPRQAPAAPVPDIPEAIDLAGATPGAVLAHDELPLADYDHLTLGSLRARLPKLDAVALAQLIDYERVHANRLPVLTLLQNRLAKVR
jgi:hypothetical protein